MSYASRLLQMTGSAARPARPAVHEVVEHLPAAAPARPVHAAPPPQPQQQAPIVRPAQVAVQAPPAPRRARDDEPPPEPSPPESAQTRPVAQPPAPRAAAPPPRDWLDDAPDRTDPLDTIDTSDDMRALLHAVRQWTAPAAREPATRSVEVIEQTIIETPPTAEPPSAPAVTVDRHEEPVQVSIGNVMITVEDAPVTSRAAATSRSPSAASNRFARHYLRGR